MTSRTVYCLFPDIRPAPLLADSGRIDGRCGASLFVVGDPLFEDGELLEFETREAAVEGAHARGLCDMHVMQTNISVFVPRAQKSFSIGGQYRPFPEVPRKRAYEWPIR